MLCLHAVTDEDGHHLEDEGESGRRLCEYWGTIFQARAEGPRHGQYEEVLRYVQQAPVDISWTIDRAEFDELIALKKDSAPGPDGIPNGVYKCAGGLGAHFLFNTYKYLVEGGAVLELFAIGRTVFIPKSSDIDDNGRIVRSLDALGPLTLCNCDCKLLTSAICRGLHWFSMRCIHPSQRCVASRQMTDNIFEIETAALAHVACAPQESGILLADFAAVYHSVKHTWILSVIEETELLGFIGRFLRSMYHDSITHVEFAGATRGRFRMARGVRQGCPASGFLFAMAFDPIFRWLQEAVVPRNPHNLDFLQPAQCACADDVAVAAPSFRNLMTAVSPAFQSVDNTAGLNLKYRKCCWVQYGTEARDSLCSWTSENCGELREMQIVKHAKNIGTMIGPDGYLHRWTAPRKKIIQRVMKINASTKSLVERLCDLTIYAISLLSFIGSVCAPDQATLNAENHTLQCTTAGPYNAFFFRSFSKLARCVVLVPIWWVSTPSAWRPAIELLHVRPRLDKVLRNPIGSRT